MIQFLLNGNKKIIMAKKYYRMRKYRKADEIVDLIKIKYQSK
jgi:hypothetical protein